MTDDLPTPPLPEAMSSTRVGCRVGKRDGAPLGVTMSGVGAGRRSRIAVEPLPQRSQLTVAHHGEVDADDGDAASRPCMASVTRLVDLGPQRAARNREGDLDRDVASGDGDVLDHAQVDDAAM